MSGEVRASSKVERGTVSEDPSVVPATATTAHPPTHSHCLNRASLKGKGRLEGMVILTLRNSTSAEYGRYKPPPEESASPTRHLRSKPLLKPVLGSYLSAVDAVLYCTAQRISLSTALFSTAENTQHGIYILRTAAPVAQRN